MSDQKDNDQRQYIEEDEIDLLELFGVIWRYKWVILWVTLLAAVVSVAFSIISLKLPPEQSPLPNRYKSSALILINEESSGDLSSMLAQSGLSSFAGIAGVSSGPSYAMLAEKLITSRSLIDTIVEEFNIIEKYNITERIKSNSRNRIKISLSIDHDKETGTITISYEHIDPVFAKDIVNRVIELLDKQFASIGGNRTLTRKNLLEQKLAEVEAEIAKLEAKIQEFQRKHGVLDVESLAQEQIATLAQLRSQLISKEMEIKTYSNFARINDPVLQRIKAERDNLAKLLKDIEAGYSDYESLLPSTEDLPALALEFEHMKRDLQVQAKIYEILTQQYEVAKLNAEGQEPIFQVLETAEVPDLKSGPSRGIICMVATVGAFFFSIIFVFVINAWKNIKNDPERMRKLTGKDLP